MRAKKLLALAVVFTLGAVLALAQSEPVQPAPAGASGAVKAGTIVSLDNVAKTATVRETGSDAAAAGAASSEVVLYWDETTKIEGTLKEGETVRFKATQKDGRTLATWIQVGKSAKPQTPAM